MNLRDNKKTARRNLHLAEFSLQHLVNLSHDMRTPLSIILNAVQLLESRTDAENVPELEEIRRNAQQLSRMTSNIIDLASLDAGHLRMRLHTMECVAWLQEVGLACAPYARHKGVEFTFVTNLTEIWLICDEVYLERCVLNLISNAVRFTEPGGLICLSVETLRRKACISVSDNGCGMGTKQLGHLFQRFGGSEADTRVRAGSGLGLALVKSLIEAMSGGIEIESELGEGTCARLFLPMANEARGVRGASEPSGDTEIRAAIELAELMNPQES